MTPIPTEICKQRPPPRLNLAASLLFAPKELQQYLCFRRSTILRLSNSELERIPTASEHADFLTWKGKQCAKELLDNLFNPCSSFGDLSAHLSPMKNTHSESYETFISFVTATKCGHVLHPGTPYPHASASQPLNIDRCPPCTISMHLTYMALLTKALNTSGGPVRPRGAPDSQHEAVFQAWNVGKLNLVQTIYQYEEWAKHEEDFRRCMYTNLSAWERKSAEKSLQNVHGAQEALELYYERELELRPGSEAKVAQQKTEKNSQKCGKRRVGFREGTCFEPSRCHAYFCRKSPRFDGKYLRQRIYEDEDTESESDVEIPAIVDDDTESDCSDMEESPLEHCTNRKVVQQHQANANSGVELDVMDFTLNVSFESSSSSSDTAARGLSSESESASQSDTDVEDMEVEGCSESSPFQFASEYDDSRDEEDGSEENDDGSDNESSGSEGGWDEYDENFDEVDGGDFIIFG